LLELFRELTRRLKSVLPAESTLARFKHDTFAAFLPGADAATLETVAQTLHQALAPEIRVGARRLFLTGSVGLALEPDDANGAERLLHAAQLAVHQGKSMGRGQSRFYAPDLNEKADQRLSLIAELRRALNEDQFLLHYQPIFDAAGKLHGFEALLRWQHPERGLLLPVDFVPVLESAGISGAVDLMVLRKAVGQIKLWRLRSGQDYAIAVNVSAESFQRPDFPKILQILLDEFGIAAKAVELEIVESMALENLELGLALLTQLRAMGVSVSLDDFGTGFSSLSHLRVLPVHRIKIDRSFVRDVNFDRKDAAIVSAIIELAHSLDLTVVAEGVETADQRAFLLAHGVDFLQGFLLASPMPAAEAEALILQHFSDKNVVPISAAYRS
jgi:EAL domain-containing protein (putative c-di-GMP-specific phosphodiesterase class I)